MNRVLVSTAASVIQRGWPFWEWSWRLDEPDSRLGAQAKIERRKKISKERYMKRLRWAWEKAEQWLSERAGAWTREEVLEAIRDVQVFVGEAPLAEDERLVIARACEVAAGIGTFRPAMPRKRPQRRPD